MIVVTTMITIISTNTPALHWLYDCSFKRVCMCARSFVLESISLDKGFHVIRAPFQMLFSFKRYFVYKKLCFRKHLPL